MRQLCVWRVRTQVRSETPDVCDPECAMVAVDARWMMELALPSRTTPPAPCRMAVNPRGGPLRERWHMAQNLNESEWLLCDDVQPPCLVFSVGIGNHWQFDLAAASRGCEVHSFDPTPELRSKHERNVRYYRQHNLNIHFHYLGLGSTSENITSSYGKSGLGPVAHLGKLIRMYAKGRSIDVLK